jgi:hypothetical protein
MHTPLSEVKKELLTNPAWQDAVPIWQAAFFTDSSRLAKEIQRATYPGLAFELFDAARQRYLDACALVSVDTELTSLIRQVQPLERPFLKRAYRKIAAFYRFAFVGDRQTKLPFPSPASGTASTTGDETENLEQSWRNFLRNEARRLARIDHIAISLLRAVAFGDSAEARAAEAHVVDMLDERYGRFHLQRRLQLLELSIHPEELESWRFIEGPDWDQVELDPRVRPDPPI